MKVGEQPNVEGAVGEEKAAGGRAPKGLLL